MEQGNLGERVREARKARDLSQEALAREAGVSLNLVNKLERGVITDPHYSTLSGLAGALDVSLYELLEEEAPKVQAPLPLDPRVAGEHTSQLDPHLWRGYCDHLAGVFAAFADRTDAPPEQVSGWAEMVSFTAGYVVNLVSTLDKMVSDNWFSDEDNEMVPLLRSAYRMAQQGDRVIRRSIEGPEKEIEARFWEIVGGMSLTDEQRKAITA